MNTEDRQSKIIQQSLLKWISLFTQKQFLSFDQLIQGQFYIEYLSKIPHFKFVKPLKFDLYQTGLTQNNSLSLANRISNIKIIGQSIVRYYQTCLMKDISQMKINYVQLCMGSSSQNIKLFSFLIGIFASINQIRDQKLKNQQIFKLLTTSLQKLQKQDQYIIRALLQNSKTIGESINIKNDENDGFSNQKIIISQFQEYEEKIQRLQSQIQGLRIELQEQKNINQYNQGQMKQLKAQKTKLLQKCQVLQVLNSRLQSQNSSFVLQNQNLAKKLQTQKRNYQLSIIKLNEKNSLIQKELVNLPFYKQKINDIQKINQQLKQQIKQNTVYLAQQQAKFKLMKISYSEIQQKYKKLQQNYNHLEQEYQNYMFQTENQCSSSQKKNKRNKITANQQYYLMMSNNSRLSSIKYRIKDKLQSAMKGQLSQYQMVHSNVIDIPIQLHRKNYSESQQNLSLFNNRICESQNQQNRFGTLQGELNNINSQVFNNYYNLSNFVIKQAQHSHENMRNTSEFNDDEQCQAHIKTSKINKNSGYLHSLKSQKLDQSLIVEQDELALQQSQRQNKRFKKQQGKQGQRKNNQNKNKLLNQLQKNQIQQILHKLEKYSHCLNDMSPQQLSSPLHLIKRIQKISLQYQSQIDLLTIIVSDLFSQNQLHKKQLYKYTLIKKDNKNRYQLFKKQLNSIRQFQSIQQINQQFQIVRKQLASNVEIKLNNKGYETGKEKCIKPKQEQNDLSQSRKHFPLSLNRINNKDKQNINLLNNPSIKQKKQHKANNSYCKDINKKVDYKQKSLNKIMTFKQSIKKEQIEEKSLLPNQINMF